MPREQLVLRTQMVPIFLAIARAREVDVAELLDRFAVPHGVIGAREAELPLNTAHELADALAQATGDPFLGLHAATWIPRGAYGLLEYSIRTAANVRQAIARLIRFSALANDLVIYQLDDDGQEARLSLRLPGAPMCVGRQANEMSIALIVRIMRESIRAPEWSPRSVWFVHPAPADPGELELRAYFKTSRIQFARESNGFAFDRADLDLPLVDADSALHALLDEQAAAVVAAKPRLNQPFWARMREQVRLALRHGVPRLEQVADDLHMSSRTLQRRLSEQGTTFNEVIEDIRHDLARLYLDQRELAVNEVAFLLGYSDLRAFARAFRRWTGMTPSQYRSRAPAGG